MTVVFTMTPTQRAIVVLTLLLITGCATPEKQLTREEWLQVRNRHYDNVSPEAVFKAAQRLFELADAGDMKFSYNDDSMIAIRWTAPFPVHVWYHWDIRASQKPTGTSVNV